MMTDYKQQKDTLPDTLSALIRVAIADMQLVMKDTDYLFNFDVWHEASEKDPCQVCLAGSVMAKSLGLNADQTVTPRIYRGSISRKLWALDELRSGTLCNPVTGEEIDQIIKSEFAIDFFDKYPGSPLIGNLTDRLLEEDDKNKFYKKALWTADWLEARGL